MFPGDQFGVQVHHLWMAPNTTCWKVLVPKFFLAQSCPPSLSINYRASHFLYEMGWVNPIIKRFMAPLTVHVRYSFHRGVGFYAETFHGAKWHCGNACENMTVLYWLNTSGMKIVIKHKIDSIRQNPEQILQLMSTSD